MSSSHHKQCWQSSLHNTRHLLCFDSWLCFNSSLCFDGPHSCLDGLRSCSTVLTRSTVLACLCFDGPHSRFNSHRSRFDRSSPVLQRSSLNRQSLLIIGRASLAIRRASQPSLGLPRSAFTFLSLLKAFHLALMRRGVVNNLLCMRRNCICTNQALIILTKSATSVVQHHAKQA